MSFASYPEYKDSGDTALGQIPNHWSVIRVGDVAKIVNGYPFDSTLFHDDGEYPLIRIRDLGVSETATRYNGNFVDAAAVTSSDVLIGMDGDFNVGRWRGTGAALLNQRMCCVRSPSTELTRLLEYALPQPLRVINDLTYATTVKHLSSFRIEKIRIALAPDQDELRDIVWFLDQETAKIDTLVAQQAKLIALLKEKRQAVISHAVTKGLDPSVPMKNSGVEWLGQVPEHWQCIRLKRLVNESVAGPYGASLTKAMYSTSGYRVYGQQQVIADDFTSGDYFISDEKYEAMRRYTVFEGDVLVSVMGTIGKVAVVPQEAAPGIINPRLVRYRCGDLIQPRYLQSVLMCQKHQEHLFLESNGTTMDGLNMVTLGRVPVPTPPRDEQTQILRYLRERAEEFDPLINQAQSASTLLQERRTALISAAVTGQIDVRGFASAKAG